MHIGFDVSQTGRRKAGCGYFAHALIRSLIAVAPQHHYSLYPTFGDSFLDPLMPLANPHRSRNVRYGPRFFSRTRAKGFWNQHDLAVKLRWPDVVHANNFWCPQQLCEPRVVYTLYDMSFATVPSFTTESNRIHCWQGMLRAVMAADWILAISISARREFLEIFPRFPAERVKVIYPASRFTCLAELGRRPRWHMRLEKAGFWLCVGTLEPRKNHRMLLDAFYQYLEAGGRPMPLVLVGGEGWHSEELKQALKEPRFSELVYRAGYVGDEELVWLYRNCFANLYPSVYEGFGLPALEGMQLGAPTIAANVTSLPEIIGDAGILLPPDDVAAWVQAMLDVSPSERIRLSHLGQKQASTFNWKKSAEQVLDLYHEVLASPKRCHSIH